MVRKPEGGDPSRGDGILPDDADVRARALSELFGTAPERPSAAVGADPQREADARDRLAQFFAGGVPSAPEGVARAAESGSSRELDEFFAAPAGPPAGAGSPVAAEVVASEPEPTSAEPRHESTDAAPQTPPVDSPSPATDLDAALNDGYELFLLDAPDEEFALDGDDLFAFDEDGTEHETTGDLLPHQGADEALPPTVAMPGASAAQTDDPPASAALSKREAKRAAEAAASGHGHFASTPRGMRAWSKGTWWAVASSVVLIAVLVGVSVLVAQNLSSQSQELQVATADFEEAADAVAGPVETMDASYAAYDETAAAARAAADSAAPALAAVSGMSDQATLDAAVAAQTALVSLLDTTTLPEPPTDYTRPDTASLTDVAALEEAEAEARQYADDVAEVVATVDAATGAVTQHATALADAQGALGATLPETAAGIAGENPLAQQKLRDDVVAAATAVGAAQAAGGSGDAELLAYATAVTALRADQERAEEEASTRRTTQPTPTPTPTTPPQPAPQPTQPAPQPTQPAPEPTTPTIP